MLSVRRAAAVLRVAVVLFVFVPSMAHAQMDAGSLRALITDQSGGVVPGATVTLTSATTGVARDLISDGEGYATFSPIQRGTYVLRVTLTGFRTHEVKDITVDVNERKFLRVSLETAALSENIEVTASSRTLQTEDGSLGQVIKGEVATQLPLAGRRYTELALLVPGATPAPGMTLDTRGPGWFLVNGNTQTQNNFMLDGFDNNNGTQNAQSLSSQVVQPNPDAIDQFKVQTNSFSAEFGRSAGAVVNVSIKSGTNAIRGSAWYYNRDASLASVSWNASHNNLPKDDLAWNQGGATFGGPILENKLFYFGSYEGFHRSFSQSGVVSVPDATVRTGVFPATIIDPQTGLPFPGNTIPKDRWDPLAAKVLAAWSAPNRPGTTSSTGINTNNYAYQAPATENTHKVDFRSDFAPSADSRFFVRYSFLRQRIYRDQILDGIVEQAGNQGEQYNVNHSTGVSWNRIFGGWVNEMRVGFTLTNADFAQPTATGMKADEFGFTGLPASQLTTGGIPGISISNYSQVGIRNFRPQFQDPRAIQFLDTVSGLFGRHAVKMGVEIRRKKDHEQDDERVSPAYTFNGTFTNNALADFMLGYAQSYVAVTNTVVDYQQEAYAGFIQDDFKISPNVTANLGLRYEYTTPMYGHGQYKNINFDPTTGQLYSASNSDPYAQDTDKNNVAPRLGLAWQIKPERYVLRAGYGIFYSGEEIHGSDDMMVFNPPQLIRAQLNASGTGPTATPAIRLSDPFPSSILTSYNSTTVSVRAHGRDWNMPQIQQWNVAFETLLPWQSSVEVAYVGNRGANEIVSLPLNAVQWGQNGSTAANRPFPQWQQITMFLTAAESKYDSMQLKFEKRQTHGLYVLASYTLANALEEAGGWGAGGHTIQDTLLPDYSNLDTLLRAARGPNTQVARHRLTLTEVWELPVGRGRAIGNTMSKALDAAVGGWQISSITSIRSGTAVDVTLATSGIDPATGLPYSFLNRNGGGILPNATGIDPNGKSSTSDLLHWLDPAAYAVQPVNTPGNARPAGAWGPGAWTTDISLVKRFTFDHVTADVRAEAFNLFNTVNYGNPSASFGSTSFGQITTAGDPRIIQLAVRVGF